MKQSSHKPYRTGSGQTSGPVRVLEVLGVILLCLAGAFLIQKSLISHTFTHVEMVDTADGYVYGIDAENASHTLFFMDPYREEGTWYTMSITEAVD